MIRKDDEIRCLEHPALTKTLNESPKGSIDGYQGLIDLQRAWAVVVGGNISLLEIHGYKRWSLIRRQVQPCQCLVDPGVWLHARIEKLPIRRPLAVNLCLRSGVEEGRRA